MPQAREPLGLASPLGPAGRRPARAPQEQHQAARRNIPPPAARTSYRRPRLPQHSPRIWNRTWRLLTAIRRNFNQSLAAHRTEPETHGSTSKWLRRFDVLEEFAASNEGEATCFTVIA